MPKAAKLDSVAWGDTTGTLSVEVETSHGKIRGLDVDGIKVSKAVSCGANTASPLSASAALPLPQHLVARGRDETRV